MEYTGTRQYIAFGLGHVLNDLVACSWFSFYLVFMTHVLLISDVQAGMLLFIGEIADALFTPFTGFLSDLYARSHGPKGRKVWLGIGCVLVAGSNPLLYEPCSICRYFPGDPARLQFFYLATAITVFQFGWSASQVNHLALLTDIGRIGHAHTILNSIRFGATVCSNFAVFVAASLMLHSCRSNITPKDADQFRLLVDGISVIGALCCSLCLCGLRTPQVVPKSPLGHSASTTLSQLFGQLDFWEVGTLYVCARLMANIVQVYLQLFVLEALGMPPLALGLVPCTLFTGQLASSLAIPSLRQWQSSTAVFSMALLAVCAGSIVAYSAFTFASKLVYLASLFLGIGCGAAMVVALALVADLASEYKHAAGGIYAAVSFADKVSSGVALLLLQYGLKHFGGFQEVSVGRREFLLSIITLIPPAVAGVALLTLVFMHHRETKGAEETEPLLPTTST